MKKRTVVPSKRSFTVLPLILLAGLLYSAVPTLHAQEYEGGVTAGCNYTPDPDVNKDIVHTSPTTLNPGSVAEANLPGGRRKMKEQTAALQEAMAKTKRSEAPVITNLDKVKAVLSGSVIETRASRDEGNAEIATMGTGRGPRSGHFIDDQNKAPSMNFASTVIDTGKSGWIEDNDWFGLNGEEQSEIGPEQLKDLLRKALEGYSGSVAGWVHRALGNNETIEGAKWMGSKTLDLLGVLFAGAKAAAASGPIVKKMLDEAGIPTSKKKLFKKGKKVLKKGVKKKIKKMLKNKNRFIARKYKISQGQSGATGTVVVVYDRKTGKFVAKAKKKNKLTGTSLDRGANAETMQKGKQEQTYKGEYGK